MKGLICMLRGVGKFFPEANELVAVLKVLAGIYGVILGMTGVYFLAVNKSIIESNETYSNMTQLIPFEFYGVAFVVAAVVLLVSVASYPLTFFIINALGAAIGSACFMVYSAASYQPEMLWYDQILAWRYGFVSLVLLIMALVGVIAWINGVWILCRKTKEDPEII